MYMYNYVTCTCTCTCTMLHVLHGTLVVRYILFRKCTPVLGESIGSYILHVCTRPVGPADSVVITLYLMEEQTLCGCYHWWAGCMVSAFVSHTAIHFGSVWLSLCDSIMLSLSYLDTQTESFAIFLKAVTVLMWKVFLHCMKTFDPYNHPHLHLSFSTVLCQCKA